MVVIVIIIIIHKYSATPNCFHMANFQDITFPHRKLRVLSMDVSMQTLLEAATNQDNLPCGYTAICAFCVHMCMQFSTQKLYYRIGNHPDQRACYKQIKTIGKERNKNCFKQDIRSKKLTLIRVFQPFPGHLKEINNRLF